MKRNAKFVRKIIPQQVRLYKKEKSVEYVCRWLRKSNKSSSSSAY
jgi:hypothetical protein